MKLRYRNKEIGLVECKSFWSRFRGFMLEKEIDRALVFDRCNSVHTFFMVRNIDIILCNEENEILYYYRDVGPNRVILPKRGVTRVYEGPVGYFDVRVNEKLEVIR